MPSAATPASLGFRLPAEWEPHAATWIAWPARPAAFLGDMAEVAKAYARVVRTIARHEPVHVIGTGKVLDEASRMVGGVPGVTLLDIPTNDSWIRDTGPTFLVSARGDARAAVAWEWNAWGGKYPPWDADAGVGRAIAARCGMQVFEPGLVLEGGAIETDGEGTLLINARCVDDPSRNPGVPRELLEQAFRDQLAAERRSEPGKPRGQSRAPRGPRRRAWPPPRGAPARHSLPLHLRRRAAAATLHQPRQGPHRHRGQPLGRGFLPHLVLLQGR